MTTKREITKEERIKKEILRMNKIFSAKSDKEKSFLEALIKRAAFMRIQLEDMEKDLSNNGFIEMFTQSATAPAYERERPTARLYSQMNKNYQTLMKQLSDFVERTENTEVKDDGFDAFINS